ncbi:hypothetical protein BaRGS_00002839 [Batillaria attramentaria]|uniref:Uncharacterized protein n=1 Tax=Batillaria attramentaria TaxID=370345 RepID=A0ABD0M353_9CAEN
MDQNTNWPNSPRVLSKNAKTRPNDVTVLWGFADIQTLRKVGYVSHALLACFPRFTAPTGLRTMDLYVRITKAESPKRKAD